MFGDNKSVADSSVTPCGKMHKRHVALLFYHVREAIAAKIINCNVINSKMNLANIIIKHWAHNDI